MLLEAVPNVSLGPQDPELEAVLERVRAAASPAAALLDVHADRDHRRAVLTLAGAPAPLVRVLTRLADALGERASLVGHEGVHPRVGLLDVAPFVAIGAPESGAERAGERLAGRLAARGVPVYRYGRLARRAETRTLAGIRARVGDAAPGGEPGLAPDEGPGRLHATMGASCVGVRDLLVAYNVLLATRDREIGRRVARAIRAREGGLPGVQALAFPLDSRGGRVQVSTNVTDVHAAGPADVYEAVRARAGEEGVDVVGGELVGLAPEAALPGDPARMGLDAEPRSLEEALGEAGLGGKPPP